MYSSVHVHTDFCDGSASPADTAAVAYRKGIAVLGFSAHVYDTVYDYGIKPCDLPAYRTEIMRVKELYRGKMQVLCGIEHDPIAPADTPLDCWDYIIGSCHGAVSKNGNYYSVDHDAESVAASLKEGFSSDGRAFVEAYFERLVRYHTEFKADIIGHFDLVKKTNKRMPFFDENSEWYRRLTVDAIDAVAQKGRAFEINTGAVSRGWRDDVYPSEIILRRINEKGGRVIITTDSHAPSTVDFFYKEAVAVAAAAGFTEIAELTADGFISHKI